MIIYVKCPKEVWAHSGCLENVKSPTPAYLILYCLMVRDQLDHRKSDCSEIFWDNETFFGMFFVLKSTVFLIKTDQCEVDFHILKMYVGDSGRGVFFEKSPVESHNYPEL